MARRPPRPGRNGTGHDGADGTSGDRHSRPGRLALLGRAGQNRGTRHTRNGRNGHTDDASDPQRLIPVRPNAQVAARVGLWGLVALGAIGGLVGLLRPAAEPAAEGTGASESATVPPEMAGFAELAVRTWIEASGDEDDAAVAALFAVNPSTAAGDSGRRRVGATETVGARRVGDPGDGGRGSVDNVENVDDYWAVTVAAGVDEFGGDRRWRSAGMWYVEIGVVKDEHGALVAVGEPALVPAPVEPAEEPRPAGGGLGVPSGDDEEMASTVEGFLSALVAGDGDVSRYVAPGVEIAPVTPAPFEQIALQRWSVTELSDTEVRIRLTARGTSAAGVPRTVSYELGLKERAGRWEVRSLSGAPTLDDDSGGPAEATTTTEPPSSTTTVSISSSPGA
jgi:Conjugative transposon protein TcpC